MPTRHSEPWNQRTECAGELRVVFRAPAGARHGSRHLVRSLALARALRVRPLLALRGSRNAIDAALILGGDVIVNPTLRALRAMRPDVLVVDDPDARQARRWIAAARQTGSLVVTIHDRGIGCTDGDLIIDGSVVQPATPRGRAALVGPAFAVLDPDLPVLKSPWANRARRVLIALGDGARARTARTIARSIVTADPDAQVRVATGLASAPAGIEERVRCVTVRHGLAHELAHADIAIVSGDVALYEACAMGVPAVALPVRREQVATVNGFARHGAALALSPRAGAHVAASAAMELLNDLDRRAGMARRSSSLVDGRGALRAAAAVRALVDAGMSDQRERRAS